LLAALCSSAEGASPMISSARLASAGVAAALAVALAEGQARAELPDSDVQARPCRPTISCTADIVVPGALEVEVGSLYSKVANEAHELTFPFLLKLSLSKFLQLQLGSNGYTSVTGAVPVRYFDNIFLGPKLHIVDQGDYRPSLAITGQVSLPTFSEPGYVPNFDAFLTGHASKDIALLHVDWNVGINTWRLDNSPLTQGFTALALSTSLSSVFGVALETYVFSSAAPAAPRDGGVRVALSSNVRSWMVVDVGGDVGFFPSTRAFSLFFGMTVVPVLFWTSNGPPKQ
jgi:hypothetical protein